MRRTKQDAQLTKESIMDASTHLFSQKGFHNTSLEDIARKAQVTRGAIYWHFKNKMEIFDSLHNALYEPFMNTILQGLENLTGHPLIQLHDLCINLLVDIANDKKRQTLMKLFITSNFTGALADHMAKHRQKKQASFEVLACYFKKAQQQGLLAADRDINCLTLALHCYLKGILVEFLQAPQYFDLEAQAKNLMDDLFKGLFQCYSQVKQD